MTEAGGLYKSEKMLREPAGCLLAHPLNITMLCGSQAMYADLGLFGLAFLSFFHMAWHQVQGIYKILRPHRAEDDPRFGPFRAMGDSKRRRLHEFLGDATPGGPRNKWVRAWMIALCAVAVLFLWAGLVRDMVVP